MIIYLDFIIVSDFDHLYRKSFSWDYLVIARNGLSSQIG